MPETYASPRFDKRPESGPVRNAYEQGDEPKTGIDFTASVEIHTLLLYPSDGGFCVRGRHL